MTAIFMLMALLFADIVLAETPPLKHLVVLGADVPLDEGDGNGTPLFYYQYFENEFTTPGLARRLTLTTSSAAFSLQIDGDVSYGMAGEVSWVSRGAYKIYDHQGTQLEDRQVKGNAVGGSFFSQWKLDPTVSVELRAIPEYFFYSENKAGQIVAPDAHSAFTMKLNVNHADISKQRFNVLKHGYEQSLTLLYHHRFDYVGLDTKQEELYQDALSFFYNGGFYQTFGSSQTLAIELYAGWQHNVDRNTASFLGAYISDRGPVPGYYYVEFQHNQFLIPSLAYGFDIWQEYHFTPSVQWAFLPGSQKIPGLTAYPRSNFGSLAAKLDGKIWGLVPFQLAYGYGLHAMRGQQQGSHEVMFYVIGGFGDVKETLPED